MLAQELVATRIFLAEKQNEINKDADGTVHFKNLNPSVIIRGISEIFNGTLGYTFKQTKLKVRNSVNAPDPYEQEVLEKFTFDNSLTEYSSIDWVKNSKSYRYMLPLYYEESCLSCHGKPAGEIDITGHTKEGASLGDLAGAISITVPLDQTYENLSTSLISIVISILVILFILSVTVYTAIHSKVVKPLEGMAQLAARFGKGDLEIEKSTFSDTYEIRVLQDNLYTMANNLKMLYETMEHQVEERTEELRKANDALQIHQRNLHHINEELSKANEVKSEFIALMSHELQTPLTSIIAYSEILIQQGPNIPESTEYLFDIYQSAHHLLDLITDLLDFSKIEKNKMNLHPTYFSFAEITTILENIYRPIVNNNDLSLSMKVPSDLPTVVADKNKIKQVLMNLFSNAIKFTPAGGSIHLQVDYEKEKEELHISIADTGRGIDPKNYNKIFEKFYQADSVMNREFGGLGLGLAVTKQMIELHGGRIWVESILGEGSTFHFTLPILLHINHKNSNGLEG